VVRVAPSQDGSVSLSELCKELRQREVMSVLVEGGGELNSSFLKEDLFDKVVLFYGPMFIGGKGASGLIAGKCIDFLKEAYRVDVVSIKRLKDDICVEGYVHRNR